MSYKEYDDFYEKAQGVGPYHMFILDVKGSKKLDPSLRSQIKLLLSSVYQRLQTLETESGKRILHTPKKKELRGDWQEPIYVYGDCIGVTVFRGSIQADTFLRIWKEEKSRLGIQLDFHFAEGDYQTDDWIFGDREYFRGYCISKLNELSKEGPLV